MKISEYLLSCRELVRFCSQNGWIDNRSLRYQILEEDDQGVVASVEFDEIVSEAAGNIANRVSCFGQVRFQLADDGNVEAFEILY